MSRTPRLVALLFWHRFLRHVHATPALRGRARGLRLVFVRPEPLPSSTHLRSNFLENFRILYRRHRHPWRQRIVFSPRSGAILVPASELWRLEALLRRNRWPGLALGDFGPRLAEVGLAALGVTGDRSVMAAVLKISLAAFKDFWRQREGYAPPPRPVLRHFFAIVAQRSCHDPERMVAVQALLSDNTDFRRAFACH